MAGPLRAPLQRAHGEPGSFLVEGVAAAAILSRTHLFVVDTSRCGDRVGVLDVFGAIGRKLPGPVGNGGTTAVAHGCSTTSTSHDELRFRSPPKPPDPVPSARRVQGQADRVPPPTS